MLQWFTLLLATLTLSTLVSATGVLFVKPTNDTPCPQQPCHTLEHYAQSWQLYLTSNTIVQFLPGEHVLEGDWNWLTVENISNLTLIGSDSMIHNSSPLGIPMATSIVSCRRGKTLFFFSNVTELFISRLTISDCGQGEVALLLTEVSNLVLDSVTIQNSHGTGLMATNLRESSIHRSAFVFNQATSALSACSSNVALRYTDSKCSEMIETFTLNITTSWILFGNSTSEEICPSGLSLQMSQSCYNMKVHIHNTTLRKNVGGNMLLLLNAFAHNIVTIADSHFESGTVQAVTGTSGGIFITSIADNPPHVSLPVQSNRVYIINTVFAKNHAELGFGGAIAVSCKSTELYIDGSKFHDNIAYLGGHIAMFGSAPPTCTNTTIVINNSLFENGKATGGGGGGVAVLGPNTNTFPCTYCNHISINNTLFVGNYAHGSGGAVALYGCIGAELNIDRSEFYNNTTPSAGGHIGLQLQLSDHNQLITINNSHFEGGKAHIGGAISLFAGGGCMFVISTTQKSLYVMNSKVYRNVANFGGGIAMTFNHSCFAFDVSIHNVFYSRNAGTNSVGGNIYLANLCTAKNTLTISRSSVEFGYASDSGGGMSITTNDSQECQSSIVSLKPTIINIVDSRFRYNTARRMGGALVVVFDSSQYFCCNAEVNITNVTFLNNKVGAVPVSHDGEELITSGGNIFIQDSTTGQWLNNTVRIHSCQIEGGVAMSGGGIRLMYLVKFAASWQKNTEMEGLFISNTRFICNQATNNSYAVSLLVEGTLLDNYSMTLNSLTPIFIKKLVIMDTTFDGSCAASSSNVQINGLKAISYLPTVYSVVFVNVSFRGYYTNSSSPLSTFHPRQLADWSLGNDLKQYITDSTLYTLSPAVQLFYIPNATFFGCEFIESYSALYVASTNTFFGGNTLFRDNIATDGAGLMLVDSSVMYLRPDTHIMFSRNHATHAGGAIYVESVDSNGTPGCFYQFYEVNQTSSDLKVQITFENNTAYFAGSALYGGLVDNCVFDTTIIRKSISFDSIFKVQNTDEDPTAVSSDPYMVCFCNNSKPQCGKQTYSSIHTYPGALFHVQAVVVGQKNGIVPGVVLAGLIKNTSAVLGDLQESQFTGKSCTTLNYTVYSSQKEETIILVTEIIPGRVTLDEHTVNVTLLPCPWGFTLNGHPTKCDCVDELRNHHITCNITTQTISRPPPLWIGYYHSDNNTEHPVEGVLVHDHCPFDYCKRTQLSIQLNDSDKQCAFNHSGILCGACQPGLSLALGTSRCLKCSNKYLMLLFAFAVAGLALVFILTLTNMTVSEGTINGLIFYANIIHINRAIFFPNESSGVNKIILNILSTFISWINLDLGIETCFYNGMDMYTKAWLQFLFPIYIWTIVGGMIVSSHYSTTAAKLFRRHAVKVLATLFLLSFAKLQRTIITALSFTFLTYPNGTKTVWLYDSNIKYLHGKHIPLFIAALLALLFLLIPYTLVLFFIQCLTKLNCRIFFWAKKLKPLFDAYTGPYKDRYRFWTGFLLIVRTILFLIFTLGNPGLNLAAISVTSTCLAFSPAVYKKAWLTVLEYSLLLNLSAVSVATFYCRDPQFSGNQAVVLYISVGTALVTFVGILAYHLYQCTINSRAWMTVSDQITQRNSHRELVNITAESSDEEEEEPAQAEERPLILQFNEYREPVLAYDDQD